MRGSQCFDGGCGAHRHKSRRFDDAVRRMKYTRAGVSVTAFTQAVESEIGVIQSFMQNRSPMKIAGFIKIAAMLRL
jgi:hypothetical protein